MIENTDKLVEEYIRWMIGIKGVRSNSCKTYRSKLNRFFRWLGTYSQDCQSMLQNITEKDVGAFMIYLKGEGQSINSQRMYITTLKGFFSWLAKYKKFGKNPAKNLVGLREFKKHPGILTVQEVERLIIACEGGNFQQVRNAAIIAVLADTGIRISELLALKVGNIQENETQFIMTVPATKNSSNRMVPFCYKQEGSLIAEMFVKYWICVKHMYQWGRDDYLFQRELVYWKRYRADGHNEKILDTRLRGYDGKHGNDGQGWIKGAEKNLEPGPLTLSSVAKMLRRIRLVAGVDKKVTPHMFRHFYATYLALHETNILIIQQRLGHASLDRTKIYLSYAEIVKSDSAKMNPMSGVKTKEKGYVKALESFNAR